MNLFKSISSKYTFYNIVCILLLTALFIPFFLMYQETIFISYEKNSMTTFADNFAAWYHREGKDEDAIRDYIDENAAQHYFIRIHDAGGALLFTSQRHPGMEPESNQTPPSPTFKMSNFYPDEYSPSAVPTESRKGHSLKLKKTYHFDNDLFYLYCKENFSMLDSIFSYTNRMMLILLVVYAAACSIMLYLISKHMTRPVKDLSQITQQIAKGDYSVRYKGRITDDEIGILTKNVNQMANTIQENIASLQNWNYLLHDRIDTLKEYAEEGRRVTAIISHELRTPLAVISSQLEMMELTEDAEKKNHYYQNCLEEIDRMSLMISRILNKSTSSRQIFTESRSIVNISNRVAALCEESRSFVETHDLQLTADIEENRTKLLFKNHVEFVFNNYLMNAVRHSRKSGKIHISLAKSGKAIRFSVFNEGNPIADKDRDRIWMDYFSTDDKAADHNGRLLENEKENYGLGLFIVKEIASIECTRCGFWNRDKGVEFWFDFVNCVLEECYD